MTTNNFNAIKNLNHGSMIRPERIDQIEEIGYVTLDYINCLLRKHFNVKEDLISNIYVDTDTGKTMLTPADIINAIKINHNDIQQTTAQIYFVSTNRSMEIKKESLMMNKYVHQI